MTITGSSNRVALFGARTTRMMPGYESLGTIAVAVALLCAACRGPGSSVPPEPVEECVQYEHAVRDCYHREVAIANQPSLIPHTRDERDGIRALCKQNLDGFKAGCR